jgi:hypothetical protein
MTATIGPDDIDIHESPRPQLLRAVSGLKPVDRGTHVMLDEVGVRSAQRLAVGDIAGITWLALWPAELKVQAQYLYGERLARPMLSAARAAGWEVSPVPQLAFWNAPPALRLYIAPPIDAIEYARRWEDGDLQWVGAYSASEIRRSVWPWLKERGYVRGDDDQVLDEWLQRCLQRRPAFLRPGLRLRRRCDPSETTEALHHAVNVVLAAADEPQFS